VHFGRDHELDAREAHLLDGVPGVRLHAYPTAGHGLVQELKHLGRLAPLLRCAVEGRPAALGWAIRRAAWHMGLRRWRTGRRDPGLAATVEEGGES
jgi:hypothetical protein